MYCVTLAILSLSFVACESGLRGPAVLKEPGEAAGRRTHLCPPPGGARSTRPLGGREAVHSDLKRIEIKSQLCDLGQILLSSKLVSSPMK